MLASGGLLYFDVQVYLSVRKVLNENQNAARLFTWAGFLQMNAGVFVLMAIVHLAIAFGILKSSEWFIRREARKP